MHAHVQVLERLASWLIPLHELPKTPELVEDKLEDISKHKERLFQTAQESLGMYMHVTCTCM